VVIEGALRVVKLAPTVHHRRQVHELFCEHDSLLGWRKIPNFSGLRVTEEYQVLEKFNSKSIRGPEYSYDKEEGSLRILILGDSFVEGYTVPFESLFSETMERELKQAGVSAQVINMGTGGYSTDQELLRFEQEGVKYHPDIVVLMVYSNDIWYNAQNIYWIGPKPMFIIEDDELRLTNVPVPLPSEGGDIFAQRELGFHRKLMKWFGENFYLYRLLAKAVTNVHWSRNIAASLGLIEGGIPDQLRVWQREHDPEVRFAWDITKRLLLRLEERVERSGGKFIISYVPERASIYPQEWAATKRKYGLSDQEWSIEQVGIDLEQFCRQHSIPFVDPTRRFREAADELHSSGESLYCVTEGHWNVSGHRLVGEILAQYIEDLLE